MQNLTQANPVNQHSEFIMSFGEGQIAASEAAMFGLVNGSDVVVSR